MLCTRRAVQPVASAVMNSVAAETSTYATISRPNYTRADDLDRDLFSLTLYCSLVYLRQVWSRVSPAWEGDDAGPEEEPP